MSSSGTRYCAALGGWMWWCSTHWQRDDRSLVREFMRQVCRSVASSADAKPIARRIASDRTVTAALRLAAADPAISSTVGAWDNAPMFAYSMALNGRIHTVSLATVVFAEADGGTRLTYTEQMCVIPPSDGLEGREHGWNALLTALEAYLVADTRANA